MRGLLTKYWVEKLSANEFLMSVVGRATASTDGGRAILKKRQQEPREYNPTKGYPGEDIHTRTPTLTL